MYTIVAPWKTMRNIHMPLPKLVCHTGILDFRLKVLRLMFRLIISEYSAAAWAGVARGWAVMQCDCNNQRLACS